MTGWFDEAEHREKKLAAMAAPDNGTPHEVLSAVLECAKAWVPEARIIGNVRAGDIARAVHSVISTPSQGERVAQDTAGRTDVDRIAHLLTGSIAATCCHKTGGYNEDPNCECRELAREIIALGLLSPQPTSTLSPHIEGENDGGGR